MKRSSGIVALVIVALLAGSAFAQEDGRREGRRRGRRGGQGDAEGRREGMRGGREGREDRGLREGRGKELLEQILAELKLPAKKRAQVTQIFETHFQAVANHAKENAPKLRELREKIAQARKAGDKDVLKQLREQRKTLGAGREQLQKKLMDQLGEVLTKEQVTKVKELMAPRRDRPSPQAILAAIRKMDLTAEQQAAMKKIMSKAEKQAVKADGPRAKAKIIGDAVAKVVKDVLTDKQRKTLETLRRRGDRGRDLLAGLDLSKEQKAKAKAIDETFRKAMESATTQEERRAAMQARRKALEELLTEKQLKALREKMREQRGQRGREGDEGRATRGRGGRDGGEDGEGRGRRGRRGGADAD